MQRAPPSRTKRPKPYARATNSNPKSRAQGNFYKPQGFLIQDSNFYDISYRLETFMKEFAEKTIPGAAFDSSERDPPPRCHPGTRLAIVERTLHFFADHEHDKRLLWVVGPAGVGKSAIMQTLAETSSTLDFTLGASLFFSVNGRDNGSKAIVTLAYQLAVKSEPYRDFVQSELAKDPTLLDKALAPQFSKFIIEPFVTQGISPEGHKRFLILIDGLDECNSQDAQCMILDLISSFCIKYPTSPLVWVIASRPEPHITRFLSRPNVTPSYTQEEIEVDSDQSREDVEGYLRKELENVRAKYPALDYYSRWPAEHNFLKLATSAGGLFAYGSAVLSYIDDPVYANPELQLQEVLEVIDEVRSRVGEGKRHPMANLDALYSRVISKIPGDMLDATKSLVLHTFCASSYSGLSKGSLQLACNWLNMTAATAYNAWFGKLEFRHKSFRDYLMEFERSGMFPNLKDESLELYVQCATRILNEVSKARKLELDPFAGILLSWPPTESITDEKRHLYTSVCWFVVKYLEKQKGADAGCNPGVLRALKLIDIQFGTETCNFVSKMPPLFFGENVRPKLKELNALQEMPIGRFKVENVPHGMSMIILCHTSEDSEPTSPECQFGYSHRSKLRPQECPPSGHSWEFSYQEDRTPQKCNCMDHALQKLEVRKTHSPDDILTAFDDVTGNYGWVYHTFPDPEQASSTWSYFVPYQFKPVIRALDVQ